MGNELIQGSLCLITPRRGLMQELLCESEEDITLMRHGDAVEIMCDSILRHRISATYTWKDVSKKIEGILAKLMEEGVLYNFKMERIA